MVYTKTKSIYLRKKENNKSELLFKKAILVSRQNIRHMQSAIFRIGIFYMEENI